MRFKHFGSCNFASLGCTICKEADSFHGKQWDSSILGIIILKTLATQFVKKLIVLIKNNEKAFNATTGGGGLKIRGHVLCVLLEFYNYLFFV
jgi:hypothetical protein